MTESRRPFNSVQPEPIDDNEDRMGSMRELDFNEQPSRAKIGDTDPQPERQRRPAGEAPTGTTDEEHDATDDDLSPETLIREDGARDALEADESFSPDWDLSIVGEADIGGGKGLDEAELAQRDPLDRKR